MVKIRLRRMGTKARPFYRIVIAKSTSGRNGAFVENIGTYDPVKKPVAVTIDSERALHWLVNGAQPSETVAYLLKQTGVLEKFFEVRPSAKVKFKTLDKRTGATSKPTSVEPAPVAAPTPKADPKPEVVEEPAAPVAEAPVETPAEGETPSA